MKVNNAHSGLRIAIRADGGGPVGFGHLSRCASLARALSRHTSKPVIEFWCRESTLAAEFLAREGFGINTVKTPESPEKTKRAISGFKPDVIVIDMAEHVPDKACEGWTAVDRNYSNELAETAPISVLLDDFAKGVFNVSLIVNGGVVPGYTEYNNENTAELLAGPQYVLLRPEFARAHKKLRDTPKNISRILIMDSGHHFTRLVPRFIYAIEKHVDSPEVTIVSKDYAENPNRMSSAVKIELIGAVQDMASKMMEADIAITGGGTILYELAATGTPAIIAPAIDHQEIISATFEKLGTVIDVGSKAKMATVGSAISRIAADKEFRAAMTAKGRGLVDGLGADRVAKKILDMAALKK